MITLKDRFLGCMYGLAIGDALGYPVEFMSQQEINFVLGEKGITGFESLRHPKISRKIAQSIGSYSDDTQMALATANALIKAKSDEPEEIMNNIIKEYVSWLESPDNNRAPGNTCMAGVRNLKIGIPWEYSGVDGEGCGAAMRTAPVGLYFFKEIRDTVQYADRISACTHREKTPRSAGIATALITALILKGANLEHIASLPETRFFNQVNTEFNNQTRLASKLLLLKSQTALPMIGQGWTGHEAVAMALYCFLKNPNDYRQTVLDAVNITGDSDSVASIAGGFSGVYNGIQSIPQEWINQIENKELLEETATKLYEKATRKSY